ncbi:MAG: hypothetical protein IPL46_30960 [Saprospiraceae bacterium]|nr:hypothetical protein [Saprospiraceae bacterium]
MRNNAFTFRFIVLIILIGLTLRPRLYAQNYGILIDSVLGFDASGMRVNYTFGNGIEVRRSVANGVQIFTALHDGVQIGSTGHDGFHISNPGNHGVYVGGAGYDGVHVYRANRWSMNIQGDRSAVGLPDGHIAQIYNRSSLTSPDVLALKVGTAGNPGAGANFITFFNGSDDILGEVQGQWHGRHYVRFDRCRLRGVPPHTRSR